MDAKGQKGAGMADMSRYVNRGPDKKFVIRRIGAETILVPLTGGAADLEAVYTLNEVGAFVWDLIDGRRSAQAIAEAITAEYDVVLEQAVRDVDELLTTLEAKGMARWSVEPGRDA
jgi:hypothetical protein